MSKEAIIKLILGFIQRHQLGVISTATNDGAPEAAVIGFGETEKLELIFETSATYRKYQNLMQNPRVAFAIGWDEEITVQYEGIVHELVGEEFDTYAEQYFAKNPAARKWQNDPDTRYFRVTPTWIRYSNLGVKPWEIHEIDLSK